jgi:hypothetical protein
MINEKATDLARRCTDLVRKGKSFVSIWDTVLKRHALVEGIPHEKLDHQRMLLCVPLITGERLVFDGGIKEFRVE